MVVRHRRSHNMESKQKNKIEFCANRIRKNAIKSNKAAMRKLFSYCEDPTVVVVYGVAKLQPGCDAASFEFRSTAPVPEMNEEMNSIPKKFGKRLSNAASKYLVSVREETGPNPDELSDGIDESGFPVPSRPVHNLSSKELDKYLPEVLRYVCAAAGVPTTGTLYASLNKRGEYKAPTLRVPGWLEAALPRGRFCGPSRRFAAGGTVRRVKLLITDFMLQHGVDPISHCRHPATRRPKDIYTTREQVYEDVEKMNMLGRESARNFVDMYGFGSGRNVGPEGDANRDSSGFEPGQYQTQVPNDGNNNNLYNHAYGRDDHSGSYHYVNRGESTGHYIETQPGYSWSEHLQ